MSKMNLLESIFVSGPTARNEVLWVGKLQRLPRLRALEKSSESEMGRLLTEVQEIRTKFRTQSS